MILASWTQLLGQSPVSQKDTSSKSYTRSELKVIALKLISGSECDALLKVSQLASAKKDTLIQSKNTIISIKDNELGIAKKVILTQDTLVNVQKKEIKKIKRHIKWLKAGWISTTMALALLFILNSLGRL